MGADEAVMLADAGLEGSDVWGTAYAMAQAIKKTGFDLVICGTQSTDAITGEVPGALAEYLGVPGLTYLRKLECDGTTVRGERETESGYQRVAAPLPALVSVTKSINEPRYRVAQRHHGREEKDDRDAERSPISRSTARSAARARRRNCSTSRPAAARGKGQTVRPPTAPTGPVSSSNS